MHERTGADPGGGGSQGSRAPPHTFEVPLSKSRKYFFLYNN